MRREWLAGVDGGGGRLRLTTNPSIWRMQKYKMVSNRSARQVERGYGERGGAGGPVYTGIETSCRRWWRSCELGRGKPGGYLALVLGADERGWRGV